MSASISLHGPFTAGARKVGPGQFTSEPFVTLDIGAKGVAVALLNMDLTSLEALSAACGEARVLLEATARAAFVAMRDEATATDLPAIVPTGTGWPVK